MFIFFFALHLFCVQTTGGSHKKYNACIIIQNIVSVNKKVGCVTKPLTHIPQHEDKSRNHIPYALLFTGPQYIDTRKANELWRIHDGAPPIVNRIGYCNTHACNRWIGDGPVKSFHDIYQWIE